MVRQVRDCLSLFVGVFMCTWEFGASEQFYELLYVAGMQAIAETEFVSRKLFACLDVGMTAWGGSLSQITSAHARNDVNSLLYSAVIVI